ncbi:MAG: CPBP family intramembrane metalloprotease [Bacteroidetes bacterium]|nr:MAG: CPBP family intramembrane metalloprotease [Bacteroidota bacterium]
MMHHTNFSVRHSILLYFLLTFLITWAALVLVMGWGGFTGREAVGEDLMPLLFLAMCAGPSLSGLICMYLTGGQAGLRDLGVRLRRWQVPLRWYLIALFTAPVLMLLVYFILSVFSDGFSPTILASEEVPLLLVGGIAGGLLAGFFEEIGWTGFAVPQLRRHFSILSAGLLVGALWGLWHLPLFTVPDPSGEVPLGILLPVKLLTILPAFRVAMVWVYDHTKSLLVVILMHVSLTASTLILQPAAATGMHIVIFNLTMTGLVYLAVWLVGTRT